MFRVGICDAARSVLEGWHPFAQPGRSAGTFDVGPQVGALGRCPALGESVGDHAVEALGPSGDLRVGDERNGTVPEFLDREPDVLAAVVQGAQITECLYELAAGFAVATGPDAD